MTLARRLVPCLDVDAGRVDKDTNFVDLRDAGDPAGIDLIGPEDPGLGWHALRLCEVRHEP